MGNVTVLGKVEHEGAVLVRPFRVVAPSAAVATSTAT